MKHWKNWKHLLNWNRLYIGAHFHQLKFTVTLFGNLLQNGNCVMAEISDIFTLTTIVSSYSVAFVFGRFWTENHGRVFLAKKVILYFVVYRLVQWIEGKYLSIKTGAFVRKPFSLTKEMKSSKLFLLSTHFCENFKTSFVYGLVSWSQIKKIEKNAFFV